MNIKQVNRTFMMIIAPFFGMLLWMLISTLTIQLSDSAMKLPDLQVWNDKNSQIMQGLDDAGSTVHFTVDTIEKSSKLYNQITDVTSSIVQTASAQAKRPETIYNRRITSKLGTPMDTVHSDKITAELYRIHQSTYSGYALKVKLKDPQAMKMTLGKDKAGGSETTMQAVKRYGAVAGVNAGGFADGGGKRYPLSTTMLNGSYVGGFEASYKDLTFVGLDKKGGLIGGKFHSQAQLDALSPSFGATFVPQLLSRGIKLTIPEKWSKSPLRAPRTVVGNYKDDQLLFMVIDGYNESGSSGATLAELQQKMINLGIQDAYNMDGGGSSSLIFKGKVINSPSDGQLRPLPTHFLFFK